MVDIYFDEVEGAEYFNNNQFNKIEYLKSMLVINEGSESKTSIVEKLKARMHDELTIKNILTENTKKKFKS